MSLKLGTIYAEAKLDTGDFRRGASELQGMVGTINTALGSISSFGIGPAFAVGAASAIAELGKIPKAAIGLNAEFEKIGIGISTTLQESAAMVPPSYEQMAKAITEAVAKEADKVSQITADMANEVADHAIAAQRSIQAVSRAGADQSRSVGSVDTRVSRFNQDQATETTQRTADFQRTSLRSQDDYQRTAIRSTQSFNNSLNDLNTSHVRSVRDSNQSVQKLELTHSRAVRDIGQSAVKASGDLNKAISSASEQAEKTMADAGRQYAEASGETNRQLMRNGQDFSHALVLRSQDFLQANGDLEEQHGRAVQDISEQAQQIVQHGADAMQAVLFQTGQQMNKLLQDQLVQMAGFSQQLEDLSAKQAANATNKFEDVRVAHERAQEDFRNAIHDQDQRLQDQNQTIEDNLKDRIDSANEITDAGKRQQAIDKATNEATKQRAKLEADVAREKERAELASQRESEDFAKKQAAQMAEDAARAGRDAQEKLRLNTNNALAIKGITDQMNAVKAQSNFTMAQNAREQQTAFANLSKRLARENADYQKQSDRLAQKYNRDNEEAQRSYDRQLEDLTRALDKEKTEYNRTVREAQARRDAEVGAAKQEYREKMAALRQQLEDEGQDYDQAQKDAQQRRADEQQDYQEHLKRLQQQRANDTADADRNYARQTEDAQRAFDRQEEASNRRSQRESEDVKTALDEIARRYEDTMRQIGEQWDDEEKRFQRTQTKQAHDFAEAQKELTDATKKATDQQEAATKPFQLKFTQGWVDATNKAQEALGRPFKFNFTDDTVQQREQLLQWVDELGKELPGSTKDATKAMVDLLQFGIDPLMKAVPDGTTTILELASALSTKPGVTGGIQQIAQAFGALATGQLGEAVQRFREVGIQIDTLPGVVKSANGELKTTAKEMFAIILQNMGPDAKRLLDNYRNSWDFLVSNLEDARDRILKAIGKSLFNESKTAIGDFTQFLDSNQTNIKDVTELIGSALGNLVKSATDFAKQIFTPESLRGIGELLGKLGELGQGIGVLEQTFERGLFGGKTLGEMIFGQPGPNDVATRAKSVSDAINSLGDTATDEVSKKFADLGVNADAVAQAFRAIHNNDAPSLQDAFDKLGISTQGLIDENGQIKVTAEEASAALVDGLTAMQGPAGATTNSFKDLVTQASQFVDWLKEIAAKEDTKKQIQDTGEAVRLFVDFIGQATVKGREFNKLLGDFTNNPVTKFFGDLLGLVGRAVDKFLEFVGVIVKVRRGLEEISPLFKIATRGPLGIIGEALLGEHPEQTSADVDALIQRTKEADAELANIQPTADQVQAAIDAMNKSLGTSATDTPAATDSITSLQDALTSMADTQPALNEFGNTLDDLQQHIDAWSSDAQDTLSSTFDGLGDTVRPQMDDFKSAVDEGLHAINGSGIIQPWIDITHDTLTTGIEKMFQDAADSTGGLADAIGEQLSAASIEVSLFVDSLDEAANEVADDLANIKQAAGGATGGGGPGANGKINMAFNVDAENKPIKDAQAQRDSDASRRKNQQEDDKREQEKQQQEKENQKNQQDQNDKQLKNEQQKTDLGAQTVEDQRTASQKAMDFLDAARAAQQQGTVAAKDAEKAAINQVKSTDDWAAVFTQLQKSEFQGGSQLGDLSPEAKAAIDAAMAAAGQAPSGTAATADALNNAASNLTDAATTIASAGTDLVGAGIGQSPGVQSASVNTGNITVNDAGIGFMAQWTDHLSDVLKAV
jgi:hypothetical protein